MQQDLESKESESKKIELTPEQEKEYERQYKILSYGTIEITPVEDFQKMLRHSIATNTPLRVKCGIDPTSPHVHLGHTVPYRKMRQFQDLGHVGVVIIGDYTASIGDPTGRNEMRPPLDRKTIEMNCRQYMEQVYTVIDQDRTELFHQTEWFQETTLRDVLKWCAQTTVSKLLQHDTFKNRIEGCQTPALHELFYPVLQGMDSVFVKADVELGGSDQRFNVLMGRDYQKEAGQRPQVAMLMPIIHGTCGSAKMSKSLGNHISILDEPFDKFGKIMSVPDEIMLEYYKYLGHMGADEFDRVESGLKDGSLHPNEAKKALAEKVVAFFHGDDDAKQMREQFEAVFKRGAVPEDTPEYRVQGGEALLDIVVDQGLMASKGEGRRLIKQNAVRFVDGDKITDVNFSLQEAHKGLVLKLGKRKFLKLI